MSWKYRSDEYDINTTTGIDLSIGGTMQPPVSMCHTGGAPAQIAADGVNATPVITEIYVATIVVPFSGLCTGLAIFNGSDATDSVKCGLYSVGGVLLRATADTQVSGTDAYQKIPWATNGANAAATTIQLASGTYYVGCIYDGTTSRFNAWGVGAFPTRRVTGAVYATAFNTTNMSITPPTTWTVTDLPPIASLY